ncbi:MAG: carboxypeptidase M32 [Clostridia bacterium]|nr:carboxypeptidase M32 [Clostridia bacterium]
MTTAQALEKLKIYENQSFTLYHAAGLMFYDGATVAPSGSAQVRANTLGELSRLAYELTTSPETVEMLETLKADIGSLDKITSRKVSELYRDYERTNKIPKDEYIAYRKLQSESDAVWHEAKEKSDFASFEPYLQKMFDSNKRMALYIEPEKHPYDTLLDDYERGLTRADCDALFSALREKLVPLIQKVCENSYKVDDSPLRRNFPIETQRRFSEFVMDLMCIDKRHCVLGETEHPFTTDFSKYDVRITTHYHEDAVASSLYSVIHEGGHALYELHTGDELQFSVLGGGASMAMHESQSRFYENVIGRSRGFCGLIFPWLKREFAPLLDDMDEDRFYRMINKSTPSLIRTEADELTYCLHVMIRYELEKKMFDGELKARDLPAEWNRMYKEYLGVDVPDDKHGVLQDSHWADGNIGYFPSYAIGSAYGAQYKREMQKEFDFDKAVKNGEIKRINDWFEQKIWRHGRMMDPGKLFESVCGKFDPECYVEYLTNKFSEVYSL